jgi:hypothetical protein
MQYLSVKNWEKFQHYKNRNIAWIKLYLSLLDDFEYTHLSDRGKVLYLHTLLLAGKHSNLIPYEVGWLKGKLALNGVIDYTELIDQQFVTLRDRTEPASALASTSASGDAILDKNKNKNKKRQECGASTFDTFWDAYPRKVSKADAQKVYSRLNPSTETLAAILAALVWQSELPDWKKSSRQFMPYPGTYLNQRRWEDPKPGSDVSGDDADMSEYTPELIENMKRIEAGL